jgi:hypothetical protein
MWDTIWQYVIKSENAGVIQAFSGAASAFFALTLVWTTICQIRIYHMARIDAMKRDRAAVFVKSFLYVPGHKIGLSHKTKAMFWDIMPEWENTGHTRTVGMMNYINVKWIGGEIIPPSSTFRTTAPLLRYNWNDCSWGQNKQCMEPQLGCPLMDWTRPSAGRDSIIAMGGLSIETYMTALSCIEPNFAAE